MSKEGFRFVERDYEILREIDRWQIITGRQIAEITGFTGQRACDRRLQKLIQAKYITRQKYLYGFPSIYSLTNTGKLLIQAPKSTQQIRLEQIIHDSYVISFSVIKGLSIAIHLLILIYIIRTRFSIQLCKFAWHNTTGLFVFISLQSYLISATAVAIVLFLIIIISFLPADCSAGLFIFYIVCV